MAIELKAFERRRTDFRHKNLSMISKCLLHIGKKDETSEKVVSALLIITKHLIKKRGGSFRHWIRSLTMQRAKILHGITDFASL